MDTSLEDQLLESFKWIEADRQKRTLKPDQIRRWSLIGSFGDKEQPLPSVKRIVSYWYRTACLFYQSGLRSEDMPRFFDLLLTDCGECCCFGCHQFFGDSADKNDWTWAWTHAAKRGHIQRCHVIPRSLGGSSKPRNLVLLCRTCHEQAPDVGNSEPMLTFLENASFDRSRRIAEDIVVGCRNANISTDEMIGLTLFVGSDEHKASWEDFEYKYATTHGFGVGYKRSTHIAAQAAYARSLGIDISQLAGNRPALRDLTIGGRRQS